jgi:predicted Rossmann fold nucleotide-binding protein DprA/Smf involved in DNA uptake
MGIDAAATEAALAAGGKAVGVLGNGIDMLLSRFERAALLELKKEGLVFPNIRE